MASALSRHIDEACAQIVKAEKNLPMIQAISIESFQRILATAKQIYPEGSETMRLQTADLVAAFGYRIDLYRVDPGTTTVQ